MPEIIPLHADWRALLAATEQMLEHAHNQDWLSLAEQDLQRQNLLKKYFSSPDTNVANTLQTERILQLQVIEEELLGLCLAERSSTAKELRDIHLGKTADKAYSSHVSNRCL